MNVDWIGFVIASVVVVLAPGPGSIFVAKTAATACQRAAFKAMLGIMAGDTCLIALSLLGVSAIFHAHPSLFHTVRLAGAAYLVVLGLQAIFTGPEERTAVTQRHDVPFWQAMMITLLNPKAVLFFMGFFPVFIKSAKNGLVTSYAVMTLAFMTISASYLSFLIQASSGIASAFQQNRALQSIMRRLCGCIFIGFGLKVAATSK